MAVITFGEFQAKLASRELCRKGVRVRLPDQSFQVLAMLLERPGQLVAREEIRRRLWPGDTFVDFDHGLNNAMNRLREALGDSAESPRFIETLPRRGYRFIGPFEDRNAPTTPVLVAEASTSVLPAGRHGRRSEIVVVAVLGVVLLAILTTGAFHVRSRGGAPHVTSLAVLPLENVSGDTSQDYFADGMTDALITNLAEITSLRVISRTSAMHYKGSAKSLPEIARELDVDAIVEGTVLKAGTRVRINAQLIDAAKDQHLWARQYEGDLKDVLQVQSALASAIALEVAGKLNPSEESRLIAKPRQIDPQAYEAYLKGEYFLEKWTAEGFGKAKEYFEQSTALDPSYPDADAGLAEYYAMAAFMGMLPPREAWLKAEDILARTLEMDSRSSKAHSLLGMVKMQFRCDPAGAERELNSALSLNPNDMRALDYHSYYLLEIGRTDEAIAEKKKVLEHDPLRVITNAELGLYFRRAGRIDDAITQLQKTLELEPTYAAAHMRLGLAYADEKQYSEAVTEIQKAISLDKKPARFAKLGEVYARWGKRREALEALRQLQQMAKQSYVAPTMSALIYARLGENKPAIALLEKASPYDDPQITDPGFNNLRSDPKFKVLEARLKPNPSCPVF